ncbi:MAG: hypothetical protein MHPSP_003391, partial [Paramarteilia canceri]
LSNGPMNGIVAAIATQHQVRVLTRKRNKIHSIVYGTPVIVDKCCNIILTNAVQQMIVSR